MSKKVLLSGSYGTGNCGDEVILQNIIDLFDSVDITVLSQDPEYTLSKFPQVRTIHQCPSMMPIRILKDILKFRFSLLARRIKFLFALKKADLFVMGGGGLLAEMVPAVLDFYSTQLRLANFFSKRTVVLSVGVGPLRTVGGKRKLSSALNGLKGMITVRDPVSQKNLEALELNKPIRLIPDLAFNQKFPPAKRDPNKVVINFYKTFADENVWKNQGYRLTKLIDAIKEVTEYLITKHNAHVYYLPFGVKEDYLFAKELHDQLNNSQCMLIEDRRNYQDCLDVLNDAHFSISMRFHAGLLSMVSGVPSLCIDQQYKSERLLSDMDMRELLVELPDGFHKEGDKDIDVDELKSKIDNIYCDYSRLCQKIESYVQREREQLNNCIKEIKEYM